MRWYQRAFLFDKNIKRINLDVRADFVLFDKGGRRMEVGDKIKYNGKHEGADFDRNGQVAEVVKIWEDSKRVAECATVMVKFPDGYEFPACKDECEVVAAKGTAAPVTAKLNARVRKSEMRRTMNLTRAVEIFQQQVQQAKTGDAITLHNGSCYYWECHPWGIVIKRGNKFWLNGGTLICHVKEGCDDWRSHPEGVVIRRGNKFWLNGQTLMLETESECLDWFLCPQGIVTEYIGKLMLNNTLLCRGKWDDWLFHPEGVIIRRGNKFWLNGKTLLCACRGRWYKWQEHPEGVVIRRGNKFWLNGKTLLYEGKWDEWQSHPDGVIIEMGGKFLLNGKTLLYEGEWWQWQSHPKGVLITIEKDILFNGKTFVCKGLLKDLYPHENGVVINRNRKLTLIVIK